MEEDHLVVAVGVGVGNDLYRLFLGFGGGRRDSAEAWISSNPSYASGGFNSN